MPSIAEQNTFTEEMDSKQRTVIFWDWDDTLLCSSFLSSEGYRLDSCMDGADDLMRQLKDLETSVIKVLESSMLRGEVHILTNAETGWVELSAQKFLPGVLPLLNKIQVVSARSTYEAMFPDSPLKWKYCAFQERLGNLLQATEINKHIISFGDSHVEREAIRAVTKDCPSTITKSIKFAERPTIEQLQRQVELATDCFGYIHSHNGDLDLCMSLSMVPTGGANQQNNQQKSEEKVITDAGSEASSKMHTTAEAPKGAGSENDASAANSCKVKSVEDKGAGMANDVVSAAS